MKFLRVLWIFPIVVMLSIGIVSCRHKDSNILYYTCPMHSQIHMDKPGHCPICGMTLVPVKKGEAPAAESSQGHDVQNVADAAHPGVYIPPDRAALAGVKTAPVIKKEVAVEMRTTGQVANNPDLVIAQKEYLVARQLGKDDTLSSYSRSKLHLLGMSDGWIKDLEKRGQPDNELYQPTRSNRVFVEAAIYESDLSNVVVGQSAAVVFTHQDNKEYTGSVVGLNPTLNAMTRAATAFIEIPQKIEPLRAGMVVTVKLSRPLGVQLVIPDSAMIDTGKRTIVVVVQDNYYDPREVELGEHADGMVVVKSGLQVGETVAVAANFLLDSEAQLKERLKTMSGHSH